jgi:N-acetyl-gamma-glutamylphosphate reductase
VSSASGVSGAGKKPSATTHFCETHENFFAYKVGKHQHTPEIEQILSEGAGTALKIDFTTHLTAGEPRYFVYDLRQKKSGRDRRASASGL